MALYREQRDISNMMKEWLAIAFDMLFSELYKIIVNKVGGDRPTLDPPLVSKRLLLYSLSNFKDMYTIALRQTCSQLHHTVVSRSILASRVARFIFSNEAKPSVKKGQQNCWKKPNTQLKKAKKSKTLYLTKPNLLKFASSQLKFT